MWSYNYSYNDELYHYGVPGMRWGRRKAQRQLNRAKRRLARYTNRSESQIGDEEAKKFLTDSVAIRKNKGLNFKTEKSGKVTYYDHSGKKVSDTYGKALSAEHKRQKITKIAGTAVAVAGAIQVSKLLLRGAAVATAANSVFK